MSSVHRQERLEAKRKRNTHAQIGAFLGGLAGFLTVLRKAQTGPIATVLLAFVGASIGGSIGRLVAALPGTLAIRRIETNNE